MAIHQFNRAIFQLDQRRTRLHPVAAIIIGNFAELMNRRAVNVTAHHCIDRIFLRILHNRGFKFSDETDRVFNALLHRGTKRPITEAEATPEKIDERIEREQELITKVARKGEPLHILHNGVELVPVNDQNLPPIRRAMNRIFLDRDVSIDAVKVGQEFIVIPGNINHTRALACLAQDFLDNVVVFLRPVTRAAQLPDVDEIADDVERLKFVVAEKIKHRVRVASAGAKMHIGNPGRAHSTFAAQFRARRFERESRQRDDVGQHVNAAAILPAFARRRQRQFCYVSVSKKSVPDFFSRQKTHALKRTERFRRVNNGQC